MTLGQPWALAFLALAVPILLIYLLRGNPRRLRTTAAFLWRGLDQQTTARRSWRRPPRSLALLLQLLALALGALALACFVKVYGAVFLGTARSEAAEQAHEAPASMIAPMAVLAGCCFVIGLLPVVIVPLLA